MQHPSNSATPISDALHVLKPGWTSALTPYMLKLCQAKERRQLSGKSVEERVHILYNSFHDSKSAQLERTDTDRLLDSSGSCTSNGASNSPGLSWGLVSPHSHSHHTQSLFRGGHC